MYDKGLSSKLNKKQEGKTSEYPGSGAFLMLLFAKENTLILFGVGINLTGGNSFTPQLVG